MLPKKIKVARTVLLIVATIVLLVISGFAIFQDRLLYYPLKADVAELVDAELHAWPDKDSFRGLLAEPAGKPRATVVVFHGNYGHVGHRLYYAKALTRLGLRVILAEYPGYGPRTGSVGEASLVPDSAETITLAHQRFGAPLLVIGESLGSGVAAAASARRRELVTGVWMITPWDQLENVAAHHYPWLPVRLLLRDRYESTANLATFSRPVLVTVAERDTIVPARFGTALYQGLSEPRRLAVLPGAGHNNWIDQVNEKWWREAITFLLGD